MGATALANGSSMIGIAEGGAYRFMWTVFGFQIGEVCCNADLLEWVQRTRSPEGEQCERSHSNNDDKEHSI